MSDVTGDHTSACGEVRGLLPAFLDGELSPARRAAVREHMDLCAACAEEMRRSAMLGEALRRDPCPDVVLPGGESAAAWVLEQEQARARRKRRWSRLIWAPGAAVAGLAAAALLFAPPPQPVPPTPVVTAAASMVVIDDERTGRQVLVIPTERGL